MRPLALALAVILLAALPGTSRADFAAGVAAYDRGDYATAFKEWQPLAEAGDPAAQRNVGHLFRKGLGVPQDALKAAEWYRRAAELGFARAQANLASMYLHGNGVPQDYAEAAKWFESAARKDYAIAQYNLALMYERGLGVERSDPKALSWYYSAARAGHKKAAERLSMLVRSVAEDGGTPDAAPAPGQSPSAARDVVATPLADADPEAPAQKTTAEVAASSPAPAADAAAESPAGKRLSNEELRRQMLARLAWERARQKEAILAAAAEREAAAEAESGAPAQPSAAATESAPSEQRAALPAQDDATEEEGAAPDAQGAAAEESETGGGRTFLYYIFGFNSDLVTQESMERGAHAFRGSRSGSSGGVDDDASPDEPVGGAKSVDEPAEEADPEDDASSLAPADGAALTASGDDAPVAAPANERLPEAPTSVEVVETAAALAVAQANALSPAVGEAPTSVEVDAAQGADEDAQASEGGSGEPAVEASPLQWILLAGAQTSGDVGDRRQAAPAAPDAQAVAANEAVDGTPDPTAEPVAAAREPSAVSTTDAPAEVPPPEPAEVQAPASPSAASGDTRISVDADTAGASDAGVDGGDKATSPPPVAVASLISNPTRFVAGQSAYDAGDYHTALSKWLPLAEKGDPEAQYLLGRSHLEGKGVLADQLRAYMWWTLAANLSHVKAAKSLRLLAAAMSEEKVLAGEILVENWNDHR